MHGSRRTGSALFADHDLLPADAIRSLPAHDRAVVLPRRMGKEMIEEIPMPAVSRVW